MLGPLLIASSFAIPNEWLARSAWSPADAEAYQQAGRDLHELSYAAPSEQNRQRLEAAQRDYTAIRARLEGSRNRGPMLRAGLRYGGIASVLVGLLAASASPPAKKS